MAFGFWPVASVFVSALLAMLVGMGLEQYKSYRSGKAAGIERQKAEISKINIAIVAFGFNLESVHTLAVQHVLPANSQIYSLRSEVQGVKNQQLSPDREQAPLSARYPAVVSTCPEIFLIEHNLLESLPFIVERNADILKDTAWIIDQCRELQAGIKNYNELIMFGWHRTMQTRGLPTHEFEAILQRQLNLNNLLCLISYQLLELLLNTIRHLEAINEQYQIPAKKSRVNIASKLEQTMEALRRITRPPELNVDTKDQTP